ncbi:Dopamine beta-hydroxylase [Sarcoptes scabiei]|uniref:Dopamine beta-hydroxylase n=1 Tax=Sarcoptes scabiei TaxID=52283 RepID=A0A834VGI3_SARSC|nr:Dopamine beta-hydroxylase [Sarcoptes scabiei]
MVSKLSSSSSSLPSSSTISTLSIINQQWFRLNRLRLSFLSFIIVFDLIASILSYEIWSVYFDETIESFDRNNRLLKQLIEIPFDEKRYVFEIQSYVENPKQILRMELMLCEKILPKDSANRWYFNDQTIYDDNGDEFVCLQTIASLQEPNIENRTIVQYPNDVGLPMVKQGSNLIEQKLLLTIEYTSELVKDYSGFDLYLMLNDTDVPIEAAIMAIGFFPDFRFFVPPDLHHWSVKGQCLSDCLQNTIAESEIKIASIVHGTNHPYLEDMIVSIIDNNNEQFGLRKEIFSYEPNRFEHKTLESNEWIFDLTRDRLIVQCNYFTANKTIKAGFSGESENCIVWLHYYPKIEIDACFSSYSLATIMSLLDLNDIKLNFPSSLQEEMDEFKTKQNQINNHIDHNDKTKQWNIGKLLRAKYSVTKGHNHIAQCGWNPFEFGYRRRK